MKNIDSFLVENNYDRFIPLIYFDMLKVEAFVT